MFKEDYVKIHIKEVGRVGIGQDSRGRGRGLIKKDLKLWCP